LLPFTLLWDKEKSDTILMSYATLRTPSNISVLNSPVALFTTRCHIGEEALNVAEREYAHYLVSVPRVSRSLFISTILVQQWGK
jgi:hypothetical protein